MEMDGKQKTGVIITVWVLVFLGFAINACTKNSIATIEMKKAMAEKGYCEFQATGIEGRLWRKCEAERASE